MQHGNSLTLPFIIHCDSNEYRKSAKVRVKNVHFLNVHVKKYSRSQDSYVLQCILLKTFVCLMFAVLAIRELFLTVNFCRFMVVGIDMKS